MLRLVGKYLLVYVIPVSTYTIMSDYDSLYAKKRIELREDREISLVSIINSVMKTSNMYLSLSLITQYSLSDRDISPQMESKMHCSKNLPSD